MLLSLHAKISCQVARVLVDCWLWGFEVVHLLDVQPAPIGDADLACNESGQAQARGGKD